MGTELSTKFTADRESLSAHVVPDWFHDAKFGIFIHWGLYSVPAWAPVGADIQELIRQGGMRALMANNPYAEWYLNSMKIKAHPTHQHHKNSYGADFEYFGFQGIFEKAASAMDAGSWADLFRQAGAKYVVMVTKHHDGYVLWPTRHPNPRRPGYFSQRDFVGELTTAVRAKGLRMGHYYSGVLDWTFNEKPITDFFTFLTNQQQPREYVEYADAHWHELIDRYGPDVLWNDIGYPAGTNVNALFARFYSQNADGIVNDRWNQTVVPNNPIGKFLMKRAVARMEKKMQSEGLELAPRCHHDFITPEYKTYPTIKAEKWETCRGIGHSFAFNQLEPASAMLSGPDLIGSLIDTVSKNGNLLLNVGPQADGTIPEMQQVPLRALGDWLSRYGKAVYGTRPWRQAEAVTADGMPLRFTARATEAGQAVYVCLHTADPSLLARTKNTYELVIPTLDDGEWDATLLPTGSAGSELRSSRTTEGLRVEIKTDLTAAQYPVIECVRRAGT